MDDIHTLDWMKIFSDDLLIVFPRVILFRYQIISLDKKMIMKNRYMCRKRKVKVLLMLLLNSVLLKVWFVTTRLCDYLIVGNN